MDPEEIHAKVAAVKERGKTDRTKLWVSAIIGAFAVGGGAGTILAPKGATADDIKRIIEPINERVAQLESRARLSEAQIIALSGEMRATMNVVRDKLANVSEAVARIDERTARKQ